MYAFISITFDSNEIETWDRCQSVRFVNSHQMICNMTHLGQSATLTLGLDIDLGSRSRIDMSRSCCISLDASWRNNTFWHPSHVFISLLSKVIVRNVYWPYDVIILTSGELWSALITTPYKGIAPPILMMSQSKFWLVMDENLSWHGIQPIVIVGAWACLTGTPNLISQYSILQQFCNWL